MFDLKLFGFEIYYFKHLQLILAVVSGVEAMVEVVAVVEVVVVVDMAVERVVMDGEDVMIMTEVTFLILHECFFLSMYMFLCRFAKHCGVIGVTNAAISKHN